METDENTDELPIEPPLKLKGGPSAMAPFRGKCIAIVAGEIKASGNTWAECLEAARRLALDSPLFFSVPAAPFVG